MAEATTVMDPNLGAANAEAADIVTKPATGVMAVVQRVTGGQSLRQILPAAGAIVISVIGLVFFVISQQPERTTLYASLPEAEKARVVEALKNSGVDVMLDPSTGDVIVPVSDYHSSRMALATCHPLYHCHDTSCRLGDDICCFGICRIQIWVHYCCCFGH